MKFRNKIFCDDDTNLAAEVGSLGAVSVIQFLHTKQEIKGNLETQKETLYEKNMEIMTASYEDSVRSFALEYAATLENNLNGIEHDLAVVTDYLQKLYQHGVSENSDYPDSLLYLQPGVTYESVEAEFLCIRSLRDMMHRILPEGSRSMIYYVSESGMLLSDLQIEYGGSEVDRRERDWYITAARSGKLYGCHHTGMH